MRRGQNHYSSQSGQNITEHQTRKLAVRVKRDLARRTLLALGSILQAANALHATPSAKTSELPRLLISLETYPPGRAPHARHSKLGQHSINAREAIGLSLVEDSNING